MAAVLVLQLVVPLVLIGWLAVRPARDVLGFVAQSAAIALGLLALALTGLWLFPPWWAPYGLAMLYVIAAVIGFRRRSPFVDVRPARTGAWVVVLASVILGAVGGQRSASAWVGRTPPAGPIVDLRFPLGGGPYLVVNGGNATVLNAHLKTLDAGIPRFRAWRGQSFAVDVVKLDRVGLRASGLLPAPPSAYRIFGEPVYAPCAGLVVAAVDGLPDMRVPEVDRTHMAGNHVTLRCGDVDVLLGHLRRGSLMVAAGRRVESGTPLAVVGNSGNTGEPHLHIHAQRRGTASAPLSGEPLPMRFDGRYLVRSDLIRSSHPVRTGVT